MQPSTIEAQHSRSDFTSIFVVIVTVLSAPIEALNYEMDWFCGICPGPLSVEEEKCGQSRTEVGYANPLSFGSPYAVCDHAYGCKTNYFKKGDRWWIEYGCGRRKYLHPNAFPAGRSGYTEPNCPHEPPAGTRVPQFCCYKFDTNNYTCYCRNSIKGDYGMIRTACNAHATDITLEPLSDYALYQNMAVNRWFNYIPSIKTTTTSTTTTTTTSTTTTPTTTRTTTTSTTTPTTTTPTTTTPTTTTPTTTTPSTTTPTTTVPATTIPTTTSTTPSTTTALATTTPTTSSPPTTTTTLITTVTSAPAPVTISTTNETTPEEEEEALRAAEVTTEASTLYVRYSRRIRSTTKSIPSILTPVVVGSLSAATTLLLVIAGSLLHWLCKKVLKAKRARADNESVELNDEIRVHRPRDHWRRVEAEEVVVQTRVKRS